MSRPDLEPASPKTWSLRIFAAVPLSPIWVGTGIGLGIFLLYLAYSAAFGSSIGTLRGVAVVNPWGAQLILALMIGFAPTISVYTIRGSLADLEELRPILTCSDAEYAELRRGITTFDPAAIRITGAIFAAAAVIWATTDSDLWTGGQRPPLTDPSFLWLAFINALSFWMTSRAIRIEITLARAFARLGSRVASIDLLDPGALAPFGRRGLRTVLLWMLFAALNSLLYTGGWAADLVPVILLGIVFWAVTGFLMPVTGAHETIRRAKRAELEQVRQAIREARDALLCDAGRTAEMAGGRLADLVAYEARIAGVREWPLDASTLLRWALYLALGLGSWLGGALVERLLEMALR